MLHGISGIADAGFDDADWRPLKSLMTKQLALHIRMRNSGLAFAE